MQNITEINECIEYLIALLHNPNCSPRLLEKLSNDKRYEIKKAIVYNPNCTIDILNKYIDENDFNELLLDILRKPNCPTELYEKIINKAKNEEDLDKAYSIILIKPNCSLETFNSFVEKHNYNYGFYNSYLKLVSNPKCPSNVLENVYNDVEAEIMHQKVYNSGAKLDYLVLLLHLIAKNPNCPRNILNILSTSEYAMARRGVASNKNTPMFIVEKLANDKDYEVLVEVAKNPNCPKDALARFLGTKYGYLKEYVASNPNLNRDLGSTLLYDEDYKVRMAFLNGPKSLPKDCFILMNDLSEHVIMAVGRKRDCPQVILENYALSENSLIRSCAAANPNTPLRVLEKLVNDRSDVVKNALASNPACPTHLLRKLYLENNQLIHKKVALNPNSDSYILEKLSEINKPELLKIVYASPHYSRVDFGYSFAYYFTKLKLLENDNLPEEELLEIASYDDYRIKGLLLDKPNLPISVLDKLYHDRDTSISRRAYKILKKRSSYLKFKSIAGDNKPNKNIPQIKLVFNEEKGNIDILKEKKQEEERKSEELKKLIFENLERNKELTRMLEAASAEEQLKYRQYLRVRIPENELLVKVDDHLEIKEEYLPYLEQIDFVYIDGNNLKVSNIDWSKTNININPQTVYKKDLSYATFADNNIVFKDFNGCILIGTDISDEKGSYGYENAIIDENTKLPMNKRGLK